MQQEKHDWFWTLICCGLLGLLLGILGCTKVTTQTAVWPMSFKNWGNPNAVAITYCDYYGNPIILLNLEELEGTDVAKAYWKYIIIHEKDHVARLMKHPGGCVGGMSQYAIDPDYRAYLEIEAKCAEFVAMNFDGHFKNPGFTFMMAFNEQYEWFGKHMTREEFFKRVPCRPP